MSSSSDPTCDPHSSDSLAHHPSSHDGVHRGITWFLRRELISVPLAVALVGTLLIFGISPATLLFVALLTVLVLGWAWSGRG